jgi:AcrR family transcriptional regulator
MARTADPQRRQTLLDEIVEYLLDQPLATLSFRTLASALGVSTYTLVYQFGSRAELLHAIVRAITTRQNVVVEAVAAETGDLTIHLSNLRASWKWFIQPRNRQLQRLEFEASMLEAQDPGDDPITPKVFRLWHKVGHDALCAMGVPVHDADLESRIVTNTIYGLQHDLIVNGDEGAATAAFERMLHAYAERVCRLIPGSDERVQQRSPAATPA